MPHTQPTADELAEAGLDFTLVGAVATITLNRPTVRNAQNPRLWAAMAQLLESLGEDTRIVVVRGAGGTFSAGLDLSLLDPSVPADQGGLIAVAEGSDQEIIDAIGAGFQLALCCDLRIVADDAKFCMKETALGLVPDLVGTKPLVEAVGYGRALDICASARMVPAAEAGEIGLAQVVVPAAELDAALDAMVASLTATSAGAVRATKALLTQAHARSLDEQRLAERTAQVGRFREVLQPPASA